MRAPAVAIVLALCMATSLGTACATLPPKELVDARVSYDRASSGYAARLDPATLRQARDALVRAEIAWREDPRAQRVKDLAYVADRIARLAEARANTRFAERRGEQDREKLRAALSRTTPRASADGR